MVFPGTLSRGCDRCRKRKIKCDGRRPGCKRCELYKAPCPGYDRPLAFRFHGEPGHSLVRGEPNAARKSIQTLVFSKGPRSYSPGFARQPQPSFEDESLAFFISEYCIYPAPGVFRGHLDFLERLYRNSSRHSCIRPATLAVAYMVLSRHYKSSTLYVTARSHYGAALRTVNRDLSAPKRPLKDETLASLMLMGMIEDIECQGQTTKAVHMAGISKLFEVVGHRVLTNVDESSLHGWIFTQMTKQIPSLLAKDDMECLAIPDAHLDTKRHGVRLALVVTRIGHFYRAARQITAAESTLTEAEKQIQLVSSIKQALAIARELAMIEKDAVPTKLRPRETADKRPATPTNQNLISFESRWTACTWCLFTLFLILFFERLYKCSDALLQLESIDDGAMQLARTAGAISEGQIKAMIHKVCSCMPYLMGEVDKQGRPLSVPERQSVIIYHLVWPLAVIIVSSHSSAEQVEDCKMRLILVRDLYGIRLAYFAPDLARNLMV